MKSKWMIDSKDMATVQAGTAVLLFLLIPVFNMLGESSNKTTAVLHGLASSLTVILSCRSIHLIYPLLRGKEGIFRELERMLWITNLLVLLSVILGNWLYISYRGPDGAQQWLFRHSPSVHTVVMEFKEFISLFPLPLGVAAAFLMRRFREEDNHQHTVISPIVAYLVTLSWLCLLIGFVFGLGLTKIKMV